MSLEELDPPTPPRQSNPANHTICFDLAVSHWLGISCFCLRLALHRALTLRQLFSLSLKRRVVLTLTLWLFVDYYTFPRLISLVSRWVKFNMLNFNFLSKCTGAFKWQKKIDSPSNCCSPRRRKQRINKNREDMKYVGHEDSAHRTRKTT